MLRFSQDKERIVQELTNKQSDLESLRTGLEVLTNRAEEVVHRHTGGLKFQFDEMSKGIQSQIGTINNDLRLASHKISAMEGHIQGMAGMAGMAGMGEGPTQTFGRKGLVDHHDQKLPLFPDDPKSVPDFRQWFANLEKHCDRTKGF